MWPAAVNGQTNDGKSALSQTDSAAEQEPLADVMDTNSGLKTSSQTVYTVHGCFKRLTRHYVVLCIFVCPKVVKQVTVQ